MASSPFHDQAVHTSRKRTFDELHCLDGDCRLVLSVPHMEMCRRMVAVSDVNLDPKKPTDLSHPTKLVVRLP